MVRYFKTLFITIVPFVLAFFLCYLIGSFVEVAFDTALWDKDTRMTTVAGGILWGIALYVKLMFEGLV